MPEKSLDIIVRARNETARGLGDAQKNFAQFGKQIAAIGGGIVGVDTAMKGLAATSMLVVAQGREQAAIHREDLVGMLDAQKEANRGWAEMGRAVPLVGDAIGKMVEALGDTKHLEEMKTAILEVRKEVEKNERLAQQWARETAVEHARLRGAPESEIMRLQSGFEATARKEPVKSAWEARRVASQNLRDQEAVVEAAQKRVESFDRMAAARRKAQAEGDTQGALLNAPVGRRSVWLAELEEAQEVYRLLEREHKKAANTYDELRRQSADKAAVSEAKAAAKANEEWQKFIAEGEKRNAERYQKEAEQQRRFMEEAARLYQEQARQEKALEEQRERERIAALTRQYAAEDEMIRERESLEDTIFAGRHSAEEVRIREIENKYGEMSRKYDPLLRPQTEADRQMFGLIEAARAAELAGIGKSSGPLQTTDVSAFSARFLTHAPGRTADPAEKTNAHLGKMESVLESIERKLDVQMGRMEWY